MSKNENECLNSRKLKIKSDLTSNETNSIVRLFCQKVLNRRMQKCCSSQKENANLTTKSKLLSRLNRVEELDTKSKENIRPEVSKMENLTQICILDDNSSVFTTTTSSNHTIDGIKPGKDRAKPRIFCFDLHHKYDSDKNELDFLLGKQKRIGLNIKGVCLNRKCFAFEKEVVASMDMPRCFDMLTEHEQIKCPLCFVSMNRHMFIEFELCDCFYKLTGKKNGSPAVHSMPRFRMTQRGHAHVIDAENWEWLEIETMPIRSETRYGNHAVYSDCCT
jgi:hypothetical protein